jgi:hypothetical protein
MSNVHNLNTNQTGRVSLLRAAMTARFPRDMADLTGATTLAEAETVCGVRCWESAILRGESFDAPAKCELCKWRRADESLSGRCGKCEAY